MNLKRHFSKLIVVIVIVFTSCSSATEQNNVEQSDQKMTAKEILGNPEYLAISYGGYRDTARSIQPTVPQLKEDLKILHAMGIRILRTYNVQLAHAPNVLKAIAELKSEDENFEMYVMLGAWIDCKNAWTDLAPDHNVESDQNEAEIGRAVALSNQYPDIVKVIAVGNEAMVKWAESYYVQPDVILKWVNHLQKLKSESQLASDLWITSSDDFSSWGGGDSLYHVDALSELIKAVDYVSMHTYPMHNTHYNPFFWGNTEDEASLDKEARIDKAMQRALEFATNQHERVSAYVDSISPGKPVHIGETGWATVSAGYYGANGSKACDELKEQKYYDMIRKWSNENGVSCFYFEAFDEQWKDAYNPRGSENHFGLITVDGKAKYALWDLVDQGVFEGLTRNGNPITKTYAGDSSKVFEAAFLPPVNMEMGVTQ